MKIFNPEICVRMASANSLMQKALDKLNNLMKTKIRKPCRNEGKMASLSELDLQNLRHLIGGYDTTHCKMKEYAECASDECVKQFFEKGARSAMDNKQQLMKFLQ